MKYNIIDTLNLGGPRRYFAPGGGRVRIPRLEGKTQIIAGKTSPEALAHWGLAYEIITEPTNPDDVLQDPQQVDGEWVTVWAPKPPMTDEEFLALVEFSIQDKLDQQAQSLGYDSIHTSVSYAEETSVPKFQKEGKALRKWRSLVWGAGYQLLEEYQAAKQSDPATPRPDVEEVLAALPDFEPPVTSSTALQ